MTRRSRGSTWSASARRGGVTTNIFVETTARNASQRDYRTFIVADATAEMGPDRHDVALRALALMFAWVVSVDWVLRAWS